MNKLVLELNKDTWTSQNFLGNHSVYNLVIKLSDKTYYAVVTDANDNTIKWIKHFTNFGQASKEGKAQLIKYGVKFTKQVRKTL